jgi:hypothetical protein
LSGTGVYHLPFTIAAPCTCQHPGHAASQLRAGILWHCVQQPGVGSSQVTTEGPLQGCHPSHATQPCRTATHLLLPRLPTCTHVCISHALQNPVVGDMFEGRDIAHAQLQQLQTVTGRCCASLPAPALRPALGNNGMAAPASGKERKHSHTHTHTVRHRTCIQSYSTTVILCRHPCKHQTWPG